MWSGNGLYLTLDFWEEAGGKAYLKVKKENAPEYERMIGICEGDEVRGKRWVVMKLLTRNFF